MYYDRVCACACEHTCVKADKVKREGDQWREITITDGQRQCTEFDQFSVLYNAMISLRAPTGGGLVVVQS